MYAKLPCPSCGKNLKISAEHFGQKARCPHCKNPITIPTPSESAAPSENVDWQSIVTDSSERVASAKPTKANPAPVAKPTSKGPTTPGSDVSLMVTAAIGLVATAVFLGTLFPIRTTYFGELFWDRGWVPMAETFLFAWAGTVLVFKFLKIRKQREAMLLDVLPTELGDEISPINVDKFLRHIRELPADASDSFLIDRMVRCLENFRIRRSNQEVASLISTQSDLVANGVISSYSIVKVAMWAIPILGFIGTVLGLSSAMGGLAGGLSQTADIEALKNQLGTITAGLGVSFDTTLVALFLSLLLAFPASTLQKQEEDLLGEVDQYCNENLLLRLQDGSGGPTAENALDVEQAVRAALDAQRGLYKQAEEQMKMLVTQNEQSMKLIAQAIAGIHGDLGKSLRESTGSLDGQVKSLTAGLESLNRVLLEMGGKPVVLSAPERRGGLFGWLGKSKGNGNHG